MKSALRYHSRQFELIEKDTYASIDDFQRLFAREMSDFFRLSLLLTADADTAETCLILALRDCSNNSTVSKEWARIWARRALIRNAIHMVIGTDNEASDDVSSEAGFDLHCLPGAYREEDLRDSIEILALPDFERLAFVICVLEQYSIMDCALLLGRSAKEVNAARVRAIDQVILTEHGVGSTPPEHA